MSTRRSRPFFLSLIVLGAACTANPESSGAAKKAPPPSPAAPAAPAAAKPAAAPLASAPATPAASAAPAKKTFKKGEVVRPGLTAEELVDYARAQGDPDEGSFTLEEALAGDPKLADPAAGTLTAIFETTMGSFECELFEKQTPNTVANFVGLARGVRHSWDKKTDKWEKRKLYDGSLFHRVIPNFMIQGGDPTGTGTGGPGYLVVDEIDRSLRHNKAGILSMANRGPNTGNSQFFVTTKATPHLDGKHAVFGQCDPKVAVAISEVKRDPMDRPLEPVRIKSMKIVRKPGK